jgi:hypothetical protein
MIELIEALQNLIKLYSVGKKPKVPRAAIFLLAQ